MKKFASITIAMLMVVSMMLSSIVSTSARTAGTGITQATGSITLTKYATGTMGKGEDEVKVDGATFVAYKVMTLTADNDGDATFTVDSDLTGVITEDDLVHTGKIGATGKLYKSTKELEEKIPAIEALAAKLESKTFTAVNNGTGQYKAEDLDLGVYLVVETVVPDGFIKDTQSFLVSIPEWDTDHWKYDIKAQPKNKPINLDKSIKDPDKNNALVNEATFEIGEVVDYVVTAEVPKYGNVPESYGVGTDTPLTTYLASFPAGSPERKQYDDLFVTFSDEFSTGLTFLGANTVVVKCGDSKVFAQGSDYTVTVENNTFEVKFDNWDVLKDYEGQAITVEYQAVVNENAQIEKENENEVTFTFINNPTTGKTQVLIDPAYVFVFQMNINKTFEGKLAADAGVDATKVAFKLYRSGDKTNAVQVVKITDGEYALYDTKTTKNPVVDGLINLAADGTLKVKGLEEGTYFLEEVKTADGYAIPTTMIEIKLGPNEIAKTGYKHIGVNPTHCTGDGAESPLKLVSGKTNTFEVDVNNVIKQFVLPTTGGDGLLIFTIAGGILMAAAIILFTTLRKKSTSK